MKHISLALLTLALVLSLSSAADARPQESRRGPERSPVTSEAPAARDAQSARKKGRSDGARTQRRPRRDAQEKGGADRLRRRAPEGQRRRSGADGAARKGSARRRAAANAQQVPWRTRRWSLAVPISLAGAQSAQLLRRMSASSLHHAGCR